jgi:hypothetical protein
LHLLDRLGVERERLDVGHRLRTTCECHRPSRPQASGLFNYERRPKINNKLAILKKKMKSENVLECWIEHNIRKKRRKSNKKSTTIWWYLWS